MKTIPGSAENPDAAQRTVIPSSSKILAVDAGQFICVNIPVRAERVHIDVSPSGGYIVNGLRPVNSESRIHRRYYVLNARLVLILPSRVDDLVPVFIAGTEHQAA